MAHKIFNMMAAVLAVSFAPVQAEEFDTGGDLNPPELGIDRVMKDISRGKSDMVSCAMGYYLTKKGDHSKARTVFKVCADAGIPAAMTWMSQLDDNGLGAEYNPEAAAEWDRRAAATGDRVGMFNYGLDLMRGHGVEQNEALGREYVDKAAKDGLKVAKRLQKAGYDLDEVTPDADNWKYNPGVF